MIEPKFPGTFSVYKRAGAAQFTLLNTRVSENGRIEKNGAVLLEAAEGSGEKSYNWNEKITFALGMSDLCQIFENPDNPPRLVHSSPNTKAIKSLEFTPGEGKYTGTYMMKIGQKDPSSNTYKNINVPVSSGEFTVLLRLLMAAAPKMIGWN